MKDAALLTAKDWLTLVLSGLGISFAPHLFFGGVILALAGASLARSFSPERDERELISVLLSALIVAVISAEFAQIYMPAYPPQLVMFVGGFCSRYAVGTALRVMGLVEKKTERIVDGAIDKVLGKDPEE
jgi:hypothetical protein